MTPDSISTCPPTLRSSPQTFNPRATLRLGMPTVQVPTPAPPTAIVAAPPVAALVANASASHAQVESFVRWASLALVFGLLASHAIVCAALLTIAINH